MSGVTIFLVAANDADIRLDRWFRSRYPGLSHGRLEKLLRTGQIRVDGRRAKASLRLAAGNQVRVPPLSAETAALEKGRSSTPAPSEADLAAAQDWVLYRDDMILAINKPAGLAVQGGSGVTRHVDALLDGLRFGSEHRPRLVHRLDKDTSGVLLLARNAAAARHLTKWFRDQELRKIYWALTIGRPDPERGRIDAAVAKKATSTGAERVIPAADGADATTFYATVDAAGSSMAWLALAPRTGRTHQLRVHCAEILHCPILGDKKYPAESDPIETAGFGAGLHLHARLLSLPHPGDAGARRARLVVVAPLPPHMTRTWHHLGFDPGTDGDPFAELYT